MGNSKRTSDGTSALVTRAQIGKLSLNSMTVQQKFNILESQEHEKSLQKIAEMHNCSRSAIQKINEDRDAIILCYQRLLEQNMDPNEHKKVKPNVKSVDLEHHMCNYVLESRQRGEELTGTAIKQRALEFAQQLGLNDFKASDGWLEKFKQRHNVLSNKFVKRRRKSKITAAASTNKNPINDYAVQQLASLHAGTSNVLDRLPTMAQSSDAVTAALSCFQTRSNPGMSLEDVSNMTHRLMEFVLQHKPDMINSSLLDIRAWLNQERQRLTQLQQEQAPASQSRKRKHHG